MLKEEKLLVPLEVLAAPWSLSRLSILTPCDTSSYCFTEGYGQTYDKSAGSYMLEENKEGTDVPGERIMITTDFTNGTMSLAHLYGRVRFFHPEECLRIAGFPSTFKWPPSFSYRDQWSCIGNSINVFVVREVMLLLSRS